MKPHLIQDLLWTQVRQRPEANAVVAPGQQALTFATLAHQAQIMAESIEALGAQPGDRIVIWACNSASIAVAVFAVLEAGCIVVPVHPKTHIDELTFILSDCQASVLAIDGDVGPIPQTNLPIFRIDLEQNGPRRQLRPVQKVTHEMLALIIYTSGSTDKPRGVACPHAQVIFACDCILKILGITSNDTVLSGLPMAFDYGLHQLFLAVSSGACLVLLRDYHNPLALPGLLSRYRVTVFPALPSLLSILLESRLLERISLPYLRLVTSTGEVFPKAHAVQLRHLLPGTAITPMYGLTECKRVSIVPPEQSAVHPDSVGLPLPGTRVMIIDDSGQPVPLGEAGELVVYGPNVAAGYWNDPEGTQLRFRIDTVSGERALYTGDRFYQDRNGYLYFVGRDGSFIKTGGHRIATVALEMMLATLSGVVEVGVIGIPNPEFGERLIIFLNVSKDTVVDKDIVLRHLATMLPSMSLRPQIIMKASKLPKSRNGKLDRSALKAIAMNEVPHGD